MKHNQIIQEIIKKYEIVLEQQLDTVSYLEEQKISAGLHLETKNKSLLALRRNQIMMSWIGLRKIMMRWIGLRKIMMRWITLRKIMNPNLQVLKINTNTWEKYPTTWSWHFATLFRQGYQSMYFCSLATIV